jgi:hypothetical protein
MPEATSRTLLLARLARTTRHKLCSLPVTSSRNTILSTDSGYLEYMQIDVCKLDLEQVPHDYPIGFSHGRQLGQPDPPSERRLRRRIGSIAVSPKLIVNLAVARAVGDGDLLALPGVLPQASPWRQ